MLIFIHTNNEVLDLLNYRQSLVRKRTSVANQLHAFARSKGLSKFRLPGVRSRKKLVEAPGTTETESLLLSSRLSLYDELTRQIKVTEAKLEEEADKEERIELIRTHPGIGPLTSLALVHTLGDVRRFRRKEEVGLVLLSDIDAHQTPSTGVHPRGVLDFTGDFIDDLSSLCVMGVRSQVHR